MNTLHYQVRPYFGRWAVVYPIPGARPGDLAALCDFRTEQAANDHAAWLNRGLEHTFDERDPALLALLRSAMRRPGNALAATTAPRITEP